MRGSDRRSVELFSYVDVEARVRVGSSAAHDPFDRQRDASCAERGVRRAPRARRRAPGGRRSRRRCCCGRCCCRRSTRSARNAS